VSRLLWTLRRYALPAARITAAVAGLVLAALGVVLLFETDNSAGALFVVGVAAACLLYALFAPRIEVQSFGVLGAQIAVRDVVGERLELARTGDSPVAGEQAAVLRNLGDVYDHVRRSQPPSGERTRLLDRLAAEVRGAAGATPFDPTEVATWFIDGSDSLRFVALNLMLVRPDKQYFVAVLEGIEHSRSGFEQYYALLVARAIVDDLSPVAREVLGETVERASRKPRLYDDASRRIVAEEILRRLQAPAPPAQAR